MITQKYLGSVLQVDESGEFKAIHHRIYSSQEICDHAGETLLSKMSPMAEGQIIWRTMPCPKIEDFSPLLKFISPTADPDKF